MGESPTGGHNAPIHDGRPDSDCCDDISLGSKREASVVVRRHTIIKILHFDASGFAATLR